MINDDVQKLQSGDNSNNYQAQGNITVINQYGITRENIQEELSSFFQENMPIFRNVAQNIANERAEELNNAFITQIAELENDIVDKIYKRLSEPDMQMAIFESQKNYAKYGDKEKLEQFVKLLIDKGIENCNSLKNILLDEAITTVTKITKIQMDFLSYLVYKHWFYADAKSIKELYEKHIKKFIPYAYTLEKITNFDIGFIKQLNCIETTNFKIVDDNIIDIIVKQYGSKFGTNNDIKRELCKIDASLIDLIEIDINYQTFYLTQVGLLIGTKNIEIKTSDIINMLFN